MVKIHKDAHYNCILTSVFRRILTATWRTLFYLTTSASNRASPYTAGSAPTLHYFSHKSAFKSSLNILCTVFSSSDDKFCSVSRLSVYNQVFNQIFARTVDLMIDIPRLLSSSVTKVLLRTVNATFKTLVIVCILSDRVLKSSYGSVYEFYPAKRKTASLQCISHHCLTSCLISRNSPPLDVFCHISAQEKVSKQKFTEYDVTRNCTVMR